MIYVFFERFAAQEAYEETLALAALRAEKRPRDYTVDELEDLIAKRRRENEAHEESQGQRACFTNLCVQL